MRRVYKVQTGVQKVYGQVDKFLAGAVVSVVGLAALAVGGPLAANAAPGNGHNTLRGDTSSTTLDACGYFVGTQKASNGYTVTNADGSTTTVERGTWTGVSNNYYNTPVQSLGAVQGAFDESQTTDTSGVTTGTETFTSNAGKITQSYMYGPTVPGGYSVSVTGTRNLAFLTSDTNGHCYTGTFPRP